MIIYHYQHIIYFTFYIFYANQEIVSPVIILRKTLRLSEIAVAIYKQLHPRAHSIRNLVRKVLKPRPSRLTEINWWIECATVGDCNTCKIAEKLLK